MTKLSTAQIKDYIVNTVVPQNKGIFDKAVDDCQYLDIDHDFLKKELSKKAAWKRHHKCKVNNMVRRLFGFQQSMMYVPPQYIGKTIPSGAGIKLMAFDIAVAVYSDEADELILSYDVLYVGEHEWEEDFYTEYHEIKEKYVYHICSMDEDGELSLNEDKDYVTICITPKSYWGKNKCVYDGHNDGPVGKFLERHGFYEDSESSFTGEDMTMAEARKLLQNSPFFEYNKEFENFLNKSMGV